jgi:hypothetical protein
MKMINNIQEFLDDQGMTTAYEWARGVYKYSGVAAWSVFLFKNNYYVYYEDIKEEEIKGNINWENCTGIKVGCSVEGSEVEIEPRVFVFPFNIEDFNESMEQLGEEEDFYWDRDNLDHYKLTVGEKDYYFTVNCGEVEWQGDEPNDENLIQKIEEFLEGELSDYDVDIEVHNAKIRRLLNDCSF